MTDPSIVDTEYGPVRGGGDGIVRWWKGVRFAAPPTGERRFRAPERPEPWTEPADATRPAAAPPQPANPIIAFPPGVVQDEDCLMLNVWAADTVAPGDAKPVMVWIHGGAYIFGGASQQLFDARQLVASGEVVVVTVQYRVGTLGFLDLSRFSTENAVFDSNLALRDVVFALEWVRENIAAFGGDPASVTVFGESAGGGIVTTLLTMPSAAGLFSRAIAQSSPATSVYHQDRAEDVARQVLARLEIQPGDAARLRELPVEALVDAGFAVYTDVPTTSPGTLAFAPIVDGDVVPEHPLEVYRAGRSHPVPLLIGTNKDETALFRLMKSPLMPISVEALEQMRAAIAQERPDLDLPEDAQIGVAYSGLRTKSQGMAVSRDIGFRMPTLWLTEAHSAVAPTYLYRFDWATPMLHLLGIGATHATELPYVWGNLVAGPKDITFRAGGLRTGSALSARMQERWRRFAIDGRPDAGSDVATWEPYTVEHRATLVIDRADTLVVDLDASLRTAWGDDVIAFL